MKHVCVFARVGEGNDPDDRGLRDQGERLPVEVAGSNVRLGKDDKGDRLITRDEPDLIRRDLHSYGRPPIVLIDRCQPEVRLIFHGAILACRMRA